MNDNESKEEEADLEERGASCEGTGEAKKRTAKGASSEWAELVHSLGIQPKPPKAPRPESMFTTEGVPNDRENI